ncbi:MAG: T9SS type A sorting domain-containing protein, partial [Sediminibacterium sp.]
QSYSDANVLFAQQRIGSAMKLWRTLDGGVTWNQVATPLNQNNMVFTLGNTPQEFWLGFTNANNSQKVFYTNDGGANYQNWSGLAIGADKIWSMCAQLGTNAGVYVALLHGRVLYRNASMTEWIEYSSGLPAGTEPIRIVPFYRDNKLRLATWNLGVYEAPLFEASSLLVDFAGERGTYVCPGETIHFVDHSVASASATYLWSFPGATPSTSAEKYPTVVYDAAGVFDVTLEVTDNGNTASKTKSSYVQSTTPSMDCVYKNFEDGSMPTEWTFGHSSGGGDVFAISDSCSAYGQGNYSLTFPNYWVDVAGNRDEIILEKQITFSNGGGTWALDFDVAYAEYGGQYSDTLAVLLSTDCGTTWNELYVKGGQTLATAPTNTNYFVPTLDQWRSEEVDIQSSVWLDAEVLVAFQNRGRFGNNIYIDNVGLCTVNAVNEMDLNEIKFYPNPTSNRSTLTFNKPTDFKKVTVTDLAGRVQVIPMVKTSTQLDFDFSKLATGVYLIQVETNFGMVVKRLEKL